MTPTHPLATSPPSVRKGVGSLLHKRSPDGYGADRRHEWLLVYREVRAETERRAENHTPEDQTVQSMPDASPVKWHRAHTTWFFEQFVLTPHAPAYRSHHPDFAFLFNSYYVAAGPRHARPKRGLLTRPDAAEVARYRAHVDEAVAAFISSAPTEQLEAAIPVFELGLQHEQQHQELMLTDILHAFSENPMTPAYDSAWHGLQCGGSAGWCDLPEGIHTIGHQGHGFCFDNETPAHRALVGPVRVCRSLVTNREWLAFMSDAGYTRPELWLSDGFAAAAAEGWAAPGHWREIDGRWFAYTLGGLQPVATEMPVCHVSYYEADAFARWVGKHLPNEAEWEVAARSGALDDAFGVVWQWTRSAYSPYPGYLPAVGALGEYNGKFMINQMVLRGSSLATPPGHTRVTYRNFFYPAARWQFTGLRLAEFPS